MDAEHWWSQVPASVSPRLSFYNLPASALESEHGASSVLSHLQAAATPEDFVSMKVDIDYVPVEGAIVRSIAQRPELSRLVDELFFEYHFDFDGGLSPNPNVSVHALVATLSDHCTARRAQASTSAGGRSQARRTTSATPSTTRSN